ncbi:uncharacterized protein F4807DRAFT_459109 [Annulohypoxylon truncatum]|uniref:uncharacterized protein n=1 Tax=Annulohypoxylon truncatum TaxID=327061 RepID=UPI0020078576|nr:uncharacterized protein F4807DRAFT_459109 [Annulohypoxylon truncatum]KAI1210882.1 hypothetical protein F4807DRAFT_459109 [Annulohypoxylon truncatum]
MALKLQPFRTGTNQIYLPKFAIALLRKGGQRPNFATFKVPLRFNKFDLRDYLLHAYNIAVLNVRSQLKPRPTHRKKNGHMVRPLPAKIMTVEMRQPFVWPARPTDITPWVSESDKARRKAITQKWNPQRELKKTGTLSLRDERGPDKEKIALREAAAQLLKTGSWKNGEGLDPKFSNPKYRPGKDI